MAQVKIASWREGGCQDGWIAFIIYVNQAPQDSWNALGTKCEAFKPWSKHGLASTSKVVYVTR